MAKQELRSLTSDELQKQVDDAREELMKLRFQQATGELTDTSRLRQTRRLIGRLLTELNVRSREVALESGQ